MVGKSKEKTSITISTFLQYENQLHRKEAQEHTVNLQQNQNLNQSTIH